MTPNMTRLEVLESPEPNKIVVWINYPYRVVYVRFIGTHSQYDKIDAQTV